MLLLTGRKAEVNDERRLIREKKPIDKSLQKPENILK